MDLPVCRICLEPDDRENLVAPCGCKGSARYVHRACIDEWRASAGSWKVEACTVCRQPFVGLGPAPPPKKASGLLSFLSRADPRSTPDPALRPGLLLSSTNAPDLDPSSFWFQCVVLLVEHDDRGSVGLVLNKPCGAPKPEDAALASRSRRAGATYESVQGGFAPWDNDAIFALAKSRSDAQALARPGGRVVAAAPDLFVARFAAPARPRVSYANRFRGLFRRRKPAGDEAPPPPAPPADGASLDLRVVHLTADWGYRQLDDECRAGHWRAHPRASPASVALLPSRGMWAGLQ